ncbi:Uncharacterized protein APZ42_030470 [Daphnia magna]|uniref:Uncharacterized protein n=1 Tax=Daphnia magna TaxID=35525 RepID=A0A164NQU9_9CRUS|nr:Uncharacterized protein APZ42_030470 [Daphnia magna]
MFSLCQSRYCQSFGPSSLALTYVVLSPSNSIVCILSFLVFYCCVSVMLILERLFCRSRRFPC